MDYWDYIRKSTFEDWGNGLRWLVYNLMGIMFPLIISFVFLISFSKWAGFVNFLSHGELCIFSASLLVAILYSLDKIEVSAGFIRIGAYALVLIVSALYAATVSKDIFSEHVELNSVFIFSSSLIIFGLSLLISYVSKVVHNSKDRWAMAYKLEDAQKSLKKSEENLEENFNKAIGNNQ